MKYRSLYLLVFLLISIAPLGCGETTQINTITSQTPTATPQPETAPESAWNTIRGKGIEISLPDTYAGGDPRTDLDAIGTRLREIDPQYERRIEAVRNNLSALALLAFDLENSDPGFVTNVNVATEPAAEDVTIEEYLDAAVKEVSTEVKVLDQKVVSLDNYQAGRMVTQGTRDDISITRLFYFIKSGNQFWLVTYSTSTGEFEERLPNFERSIRSVTLL